MKFIGPLTPLQMLARLHQLPNKSSRQHKRRHRSFIKWRGIVDGRHLPNRYRAARKVLPLP
jgi:hypothetical protein